MSDDKKIMHGPNAVAEYKKQIAERAKKAREARKANRPQIPNLAEANVSHGPDARPTTLANMAAAQQALADKPEPKDGKPQLSEATIAGMKALYEHAAKQREKKGNPPMEQQPQQPPPQAEPPSDEEEARKPVEEAKKEALRTALQDTDDLEFERIVDRINYDVINNDEQKKAVEERLKAEGSEISLADGLAEGVFRQVVPVAKGLRVHYKTVSPMENRAIRMLLWQWADKDPRIENLASDIYGMMMIVAAVEQIGTNKLPDHLVGDDIYHAEFNDEIFESKYKLLSRYPGPLIHLIGVHANWFDERVRKAMTTEALKDF